MVFRDNYITCPRCRVALEEVRSTPELRFLRCEGCEGNWVDSRILHAMFHKLKPGYPIPEMQPRHDDESELFCPTCSKPMIKRTFVRLPLDQCEKHGMWFDGKELEQTLYRYAVAE